MAYPTPNLATLDQTTPADNSVESTFAGYLRTAETATKNTVLAEHNGDGQHLWGVDTDGGGTNMTIDVGGSGILIGNAYPGLLVKVKPITTNTAAGSLTVNANSTLIATGPLQINGAAVQVGAIQAGIWIECVWDGTNWQVLNGFAITNFVTNILQRQYTATLDATSSANSFGTLNNSPPTSSGGTQIMHVTFTPKSASSFLRITAVGFFGSTLADFQVIMAAFIAAGTSPIAGSINAVAATLAGCISNYNRSACLELDCVIASPGVTQQTIAIFAGMDQGGTLTVGGEEGGSHVFGTAANIFLMVEEFI